MDVKVKGAATGKRLKAEATSRARSTASSSFRVISLNDGTVHPGSTPEPTEEELAQMDLDLKLFVGADGKAKSGDQLMEFTEQLLTTVTKHVLDRTKERSWSGVSALPSAPCNATNSTEGDSRNFPTITIDETDACTPTSTKDLAAATQV
jgi:hypothetical protein